MPSRFVPVTLGSPKFDTLEVGRFRVTDARFPPELELPHHVHERPIMAVILEGSWDEVFRTRTYECEPNTVLTEPAGERHANRFQRAGARVLVVEVDASDEELPAPCAALLDRAGCFDSVRVATLARRVVGEIHQSDALSGLATEGLVLEMLATATRDGARRRGGRPPPPWLVRVRDLLHEHFQTPPRITEAAGQAGVHPSHLAREFRTHFGASYGEYLRRVRLDWAAVRLARSDDTLAETALEAGFADQSHFTRAFRRYAGITPGRYREVARVGNRQSVVGSCNRRSAVGSRQS
jgi:AraC family transcriptional regulator